MSVSEGEEVLRVAARGDGVTASGKHVPLSAPGDTLLPDGTLRRGPHHVDPSCRHFGKCGGCQLQQCDEESLAGFVRDRVVHAAEGQGLTPELVAPVHLSPPHSRRRASLRIINGGGRAAIGFNEGSSHQVVDMRECPVLVPELFALVEPLRTLFSRRKGRLAIQAELVSTDQGVDCTLSGLTLDGLQETEALLDFCQQQGLARMTLDQGYGAEGFWEPEPVTVTLGGVAVPFPARAFLQATRDGEAALAAAVREWLGGCASVADLFAGLGTFAFHLAGQAKITAVEASRDAYLSCRLAAGRSRLPVEAVHRDLYRSPLQAGELARFDGAVLDPPRAGAKAQVEQLAASSMGRVVYISCNPSSWARDCKMLTDAGYRLQELRPVGQFRWSTHVELASLFVR